MPSITVRLTDGDKERITAAVERSGLTQSEWIRGVLLSHAQGGIPQTAGAKAGAGGIVRGQVQPAVASPTFSANNIPLAIVSDCRHPRLRRVRGLCTKCGTRVK